MLSASRSSVVTSSSAGKTLKSRARPDMTAVSRMTIASDRLSASSMSSSTAGSGTTIMIDDADDQRRDADRRTLVRGADCWGGHVRTDSRFQRGAVPRRLAA